MLMIKGRQGSESNTAVPEENALLRERKVREGEGRRDLICGLPSSLLLSWETRDPAL